MKKLRMYNIVMCSVLIILPSLLCTMVQGEEISRSDVVFKDGLLKVSVENQSFKEVVDDVAKKAGIKILTNYPDDEKISISFDYLPLEKGIRRLLKEKNYAFKYHTEEGNELENAASLMEVFVFSRSEGKHLSEFEILVQSDASQTLDTYELQNQLREKLDAALVQQNIPQNSSDITKQLRDAMDEVEIKNIADIEGQIKEALQVIQGEVNIITK